MRGLIRASLAACFAAALAGAWATTALEKLAYDIQHPQTEF
jgi:hypothetical protein